jgi:hypothetical protein
MFSDHEMTGWTTFGLSDRHNLLESPKIANSGGPSQACLQQR